MIATVSVPVSKLALSTSAMVASVPTSSSDGRAVSVQVAASPDRLVEVGASLTERTVTLTVAVSVTPPEVTV